MIIYFNASLLGKEKIDADYKAIIQILHSLKHEVIYDHILKRIHSDVNEQSPTQHQKDYQQMKNDIEKSDTMIIEATYPSIGLGHTMTLALQGHKSVLALYREPAKPHGLLIGDPDRLLSVATYRSKHKNELEKCLVSFLKRAEKRLLKIRFNLMIDSELEQHLDLIAEKNKLTKSEYVRRLINADIEKFSK